MKDAWWNDKRPLAELQFGAECQAAVIWGEHTSVCDICSGRKALGEGEVAGRMCAEGTILHAARAAEMAAVTEVTRSALAACGVVVAEDIVGLGCTGLSSHGLSVDVAKALRVNLAGSGIGLPCFIGMDRYCNVHETVGGLQDGQTQFFTGEIEKISRELTQQERFKIELVEKARRVDGSSKSSRIIKTKDILSGKDASALEGLGGDIVENPAELPPLSDVECGVEPHQPFECPEHAETLWRCRFCVAAKVADGSLVPNFVLGLAPNNLVEVAVDDVKDAVERLDASGADSIVLYAQVARWRRKLALD
jgi:hypothetical protein